MKRVRDKFAVCSAIVLGCIALVSADPRQSVEDPRPWPAENVQALDALSVHHTYITSDTAEDEGAAKEEYRLLYRTAVNLRIRSEPSAEAETLEIIPQGTLLQVADYGNGDWYFVNVDGLLGYMSAEFLDFVAIRPAGAPMYIAGSVTVMDADTGYVLYEDAQHTLRYPASITKIMTALLVLEHVEDLSEPVEFSQIAVDLPWYAGHVGMYAGDTLPVIDALYALMLVSGNEVALALAEHVSGSIEEFVYEMNRRAYSLGAVNTRFINPCGLPGADQHTTSYDMALIMRQAVQNPMFTQIIATPHAYLPPTESRDNYRPMRNTNRLIQYDDTDFNEWVLGGKTGFTNDAQHTLVTYSEVNGRSVIISVLYVPQRGGTFSDTAVLLEYIAARNTGE